MNKFYVYGLLDINNKPFYIGKGKNDRCYQHFDLNILDRDKNKHKVNKIKKIIRDTGKNPKIKIFYKNLTENEAFDIEIKIIKKIGLKNLTNIAEGGHGCPIKWTQEQKKRMSERKKGCCAWNKGLTQCYEFY